METLELKFRSKFPTEFAYRCMPSDTGSLKREIDLDEKSHIWEFDDNTFLFIRSDEDYWFVSSDKKFSMNKSVNSGDVLIVFEK